MKPIRIINKIVLLLAFPFLANSMGGPGGGGGGDCYQYNTIGTIVQCTNCTTVDGNAVGDITGDPNLEVNASACGPVTIRIRYQFDWNQGASLNWIHGISVDAGPLWTSYSVTPPAGWIFMGSGLSGLCSGSSYGPGYYYDASAASSGPPTMSYDVICAMGGGMCTAVFTNSGTNLCTAICTSDESLFGTSTGSSCCNGLTLADLGVNLNPAAGYPVVANDGNPGNNWGVNCTTDCPDFFFDLTYCPDNATPSTFIETLGLRQVQMENLVHGVQMQIVIMLMDFKLQSIMLVVQMRLLILYRIITVMPRILI